MIRRLDSRQQRILAITILLLLTAISTASIVVPLWSANKNYSENIEQMQLRLQRLKAISSNDASLRPRYEQILDAQRATGHYLSSNTEAVATAELQRLLKNLAIANGVQILSTRIFPASEEQPFVRIAIRARLRGTLPAIVATVYAIEANNTFLFLDNFSLRNQSNRRSGLQTSSTRFEIDLDLLAYMPGTS